MIPKQENKVHISAMLLSYTEPLLPAPFKIILLRLAWTNEIKKLYLGICSDKISDQIGFSRCDRSSCFFFFLSITDMKVFGWSAN